jgi:hypothetical protein
MAQRVESRIAIVAERILVIRGCRIMLDRDLADLYGVPTKRLNEQVKRNQKRFPSDFAFRLSDTEKAEVVAKCDHLTNLRYSPQCPMAFTEHGAIMLASVLNSPRAIAVSVVVVRAFVHLRQMVGANRELAERLTKLEQRLASHDIAIIRLFARLRDLMAEPAPAAIPIGFTADIR